MKSLKMSDVFKLPMMVDGHSVESQPSTQIGCVVELVSDIECDSGKDAKYVAYAINNHDRLSEENEELREIGRKATALKSECEELATALSALNVATANMCSEYKKTNLCKYVQSLLEKYGDK